MTVYGRVRGLMNLSLSQWKITDEISLISFFLLDNNAGEIETFTLRYQRLQFQFQTNLKNLRNGGILRV